MSINDIEEETPPDNSWVELFRSPIEAAVLLARHQGLRAGVRPNTKPQKPSVEGDPPLTHVVFIEFPEKTLEWEFANIDWLDRFPQYDS